MIYRIYNLHTNIKCRINNKIDRKDKKIQKLLFMCYNAIAQKGAFV